MERRKRWDVQKIKDAETAAKAAGLYWAKALKNPLIDAGELSSGLQKLVDQRRASARKPNAEKLAAFASYVEREVAIKLEALASEPEGAVLELKVGTHPNSLLRSCAVEAGVSLIITDWPWNTTTTVTQDEIILQRGRTGKAKKIWTRPS